MAPNAVSNISQIEYDYSEYYDDLEEEAETSKIRRDASNEVETVTVNTIYYPSNIPCQESPMNQTEVDSLKTNRRKKKLKLKAKTRR